MRLQSLLCLLCCAFAVLRWVCGFYRSVSSVESVSSRESKQQGGALVLWRTEEQLLRLLSPRRPRRHGARRRREGQARRTRLVRIVVLRQHDNLIPRAHDEVERWVHEDRALAHDADRHCIRKAQHHVAEAPTRQRRPLLHVELCAPNRRGWSWPLSNALLEHGAGRYRCPQTRRAAR